jgi:hypothetical protein
MSLEWERIWGLPERLEASFLLPFWSCNNSREFGTIFVWARRKKARIGARRRFPCEIVQLRAFCGAVRRNVRRNVRKNNMHLTLGVHAQDNTIHHSSQQHHHHHHIKQAARTQHKIIKVAVSLWCCNTSSLTLSDCCATAISVNNCRVVALRRNPKWTTRNLQRQTVWWKQPPVQTQQHPLAYRYLYKGKPLSIRWIFPF